VGPRASMTERTWVLLAEAPEGGWGLWGHAHLNEELVTAARADREAPGLAKQLEGENER